MAGSWKVSLMDFHSRWVGRTKIVSMTEHYWCWLMPKSVPSYGKEGCFVILWLLWREVEVQTSWLRTGLRGRPEPFYRAPALSLCKKESLLRHWYPAQWGLQLLSLWEDLCIHPTSLSVCSRRVYPLDCRSSLVKLSSISGLHPWNLISYLQLYHCLVRYYLSLQIFLLWNPGHSHYLHNTERRNAPVSKLSER